MGNSIYSLFVSFSHWYILHIHFREKNNVQNLQCMCESVSLQNYLKNVEMAKTLTEHQAHTLVFVEITISKTTESGLLLMTQSVGMV